MYDAKLRSSSVVNCLFYLFLNSAIHLKESLLQIGYIQSPPHLKNTRRYPAPAGASVWSGTTTEERQRDRTGSPSTMWPARGHPFPTNATAPIVRARAEQRAIRRSTSPGRRGAYEAKPSQQTQQLESDRPKLGATHIRRSPNSYRRSRHWRRPFLPAFNVSN